MQQPETKTSKRFYKKPTVSVESHLKGPIPDIETPDNFPEYLAETRSEYSLKEFSGDPDDKAKQDEVNRVRRSYSLGERLHGILSDGDSETLTDYIRWRFVDPTHVFPTNGLTLFTYVCAGECYGNNRIQLVRTLMAAGVNPLKKDSHKNTALTYSCPEVVEMIKNIIVRVKITVAKKTESITVKLMASEV
jgi:hypothetical protein